MKIAKDLIPTKACWQCDGEGGLYDGHAMPEGYYLMCGMHWVAINALGCWAPADVSKATRWPTKEAVVANQERLQKCGIPSTLEVVHVPECSECHGTGVVDLERDGEEYDDFND